MARAPTADEEREMNLKRKKEEMEVVNDVEDDDDEDDVDDDDDESTSLAEKEETVPETDEADTTSAKDVRSILQEDIARMRDLPERYKSNSIKEKACALYVADFQAALRRTISREAITFRRGEKRMRGEKIIDDLFEITPGELSRAVRYSEHRHVCRGSRRVRTPHKSRVATSYGSIPYVHNGMPEG